MIHSSLYLIKKHKATKGFPTKDIRKHTAAPFGIPVLKDWEDFMEQKPTPHDGQYFVMGNSFPTRRSSDLKIIISEHFRQDGKPLISILEKVILDAGKMPESRINTA